MDVGAQSRVVRKIPTWIVGIFVDNNRVARPIPASHETDIGGRDAKVESAKPEATGAAARETKNMSRAKPTREVSVSPRMVHVVLRSAAVVSNPFTISVNMRRVGMPLCVAQISLRDGGLPWRFRPWRFRTRRRRLAVSRGRRSFRRNVPVSNIVRRRLFFVAFLR